MSIAERINEATRKYINSDFDNAIIQAFIAIDATAKKVLNIDNNKKRFLELTENNIDIISLTMFLIEKIPNDNFLDGKKFSELIYKMRCSILHEGFLNKVKWDEKRLSYEDDVFIVPHSLVIALIFVVLAQSENKNENIEHGLYTEFFYKEKEIMFRYSEYLGEKEKMMNLFQHLLST
jgi:hypothetical protein